MGRKYSVHWNVGLANDEERTSRFKVGGCPLRKLDAYSEIIGLIAMHRRVGYDPVECFSPGHVSIHVRKAVR